MAIAARRDLVAVIARRAINGRIVHISAGQVPCSDDRDDIIDGLAGAVKALAYDAVSDRGNAAEMRVPAGCAWRGNRLLGAGMSGYGYDLRVRARAPETR